MLLPMLALIAAQDLATPTGRWKNPSGSVIVTIDNCGAAYCGKVEWASDKAKADAGKGGTMTLIGTQLMTGFITAGIGKWKGQLFIPDLNRRSKAELRLQGDGQLKVTGCAVGRMICKSQSWTRAD